MKEILLGKTGKVALVDDDDYGRVSKYKWYLYNNGYAVRQWMVKSKVHQETMHRFILNNPDGVIDHINRNQLDNRKDNLRIVSQSINMLNRKISSNNTSGVMGVYKRKDKWLARLVFQGKAVFERLYPTLDEAAKARRSVEIEYGKVVPSYRNT